MCWRLVALTWQIVHVKPSQGQRHEQRDGPNELNLEEVLATHVRCLALAIRTSKADTIVAETKQE
jgi:hypothetical protein